MNAAIAEITALQLDDHQNPESKQLTEDVADCPAAVEEGEDPELDDVTGTGFQFCTFLNIFRGN